MTPLEKALREAVEANDRYASAFTDGATTSEQLERLYDRTLTTARYLVRDHRDELMSLVGERYKTALDEADNAEFFHDGLEGDLLEVSNKSGAYVLGWQECVEFIRERAAPPQEDDDA